MHSASENYLYLLNDPSFVAEIEKFPELIVAKIKKLKVRVNSVQDKSVKDEINKAIEQLNIIDERLREKIAVSCVVSTSVMTQPMVAEVNRSYSTPSRCSQTSYLRVEGDISSGIVKLLRGVRIQP